MAKYLLFNRRVIAKCESRKFLIHGYEYEYECESDVVFVRDTEKHIWERDYGCTFNYNHQEHYNGLLEEIDYDEEKEEILDIRGAQGWWVSESEVEDCKARRQVIEYFKKTNITYSDIYGSFGAKGSKQTAEGVRESFEQFPDLMAGWPGHKTEVREKIEETEQGNSENPTDYVEGVSETVMEVKQGDYSENGEIKSWKSSAEMILDYIQSMRDKNNQLKADIEKVFKDYNKDDLKKNDVTDKNGNIIGYSISSKNGEKKYRVCEFDNEDNLIRIEDTGYIIDWDNCPESHTVLSIRFDKNGKIISWFTWDYLPEDGIGWDWYYTEYDESGKVIEDEYRGRI